MLVPKVDRRAVLSASLALLIGGCFDDAAKKKSGSSVMQLSDAELQAIAAELNAPILDAASPPPFKSKHQFTASDIPARLAGIDWFSNCGKDFSLDLTMPVKTVKSWDDATRLCQSMQWAHARLESLNQLRVWLHENDKANFQKWNEVVAKHQNTTIAVLAPTIKQLQIRQSLDTAVVDNVLGDILQALLENSYLSSGHSEFFSLELLTVYEAGHFPCGWLGDWPDGHLIVF